MEPRVTLGIPHVGNWPGYFVDTVMYLKKTPGASIIRVENKPVDVARNLIVETFLQTDATHLLFLDADMTFPGDTILRLLSRDKDVIGGTYFARTDTPIPHIYDFQRVDDLGRRWYASKGREMADYLKRHPEHSVFGHAAVLQDSDDALLRCDALATGCLLIRREVFEAIEPPWFKCWPDTAAGEVFYFCDKARNAGFDLWADLTVQCGHAAQMVFIGREDFVETFGIGSPDEHDFSEPVLVEAGPNGRRVRLGPKPADFVFPKDVEGYVIEDVARMLNELARQVPADGLIVELGSFKGRSTISLAMSGRATWAVDNFKGEALEAVDDKVIVRNHPDHITGGYKEALIDNLSRYGVADNVRIFDRDTAIPPDLVEPSIDLLFVDAAHDYESVTADLAAWEPWVKDDGVIVLDDVNFPGVAKAAADLAGRGWRLLTGSNQTIALKRTGEAL